MPLRSSRATQDLTAGPMAAEFDFGYAVRLITVYVHFSALVTEEINISFKSKDGSDWDTLICKQLMAEESDFVFAAPGDIGLNEGDKLKVDITNANGVGSAFVTIKAEWRP